MKLFKWFQSKFYSDKNIVIEELRKEIDRLKKENEINKSKIIKFQSDFCKENIKVEFYDKNIEDKILKNISNAKEEICIAVAWVTYYKYIDAIEKLIERGVKVRIIIDDNKENREGKEFNKLNDICSGLKIVKIYSDDINKKRIMHNKYCIIDNDKVIDGSYNWSFNAKFNEEHIVIINSHAVAKMFKKNFDRIYNSYNNS